jgi:hypothetical protein
LVVTSEQLNALTALIAVIISPLISIYVVKKEINSKVLSENRQLWINSLRERIATFTTLIKTPTPLTDDFAAGMAARAERTRLISQLANEIALHINPNEDDHAELVRLVRGAETRSGANPNPAPEDAQIIELAQRILKREWQRVKEGK